jgi:hypothetical protein
MARFERYGVLGTEVDGVFFTEASRIDGAQELGEVRATSNRQNTNLDQLKRDLANQVLVKGGDCVLGFGYAQKGTFWSFSSTQVNAWGTAGKTPA